jgi:hypothetical protein
MANVLGFDKQVTIIGSLAEGSSIRSIERMTGVHLDTIMRLGVKVGQGCAKIHDGIMRDLPCTHLQMDEIWGYIGKKQRHVAPSDDPSMGDADRAKHRVTVLHSHPIESARQAVRAAIVQEFRSLESAN